MLYYFISLLFNKHNFIVHSLSIYLWLCNHIIGQCCDFVNIQLCSQFIFIYIYIYYRTGCSQFYRKSSNVRFFCSCYEIRLTGVFSQKICTFKQVFKIKIVSSKFNLPLCASRCSGSMWAMTVRSSGTQEPNANVRMVVESCQDFRLLIPAVIYIIIFISPNMVE